MNKDNLSHLFETLQSDFDIETPNKGHEHRFLDKLNANREQPVAVTKPKRNLWKPFIGIAASIALILTFTFTLNTEEDIKDLASVSPEMANTQHFFSAVIEEELSKVEQERTPETEALIKDALSQMEILEEEYQLLKVDLTESGNDKRVIHAMITNFLNRVDVLKSVLQSIEEVKIIKQQHSDETNNTI